MDELAIGCVKGVTTVISAATDDLVGWWHSCNNITECDYVASRLTTRQVK